MGRFNLLDEPWISVVVNDRGKTQEVSLKELFEHAHEYQDLAGDTKTQDFAVFRVLLAVLHTVFSRFDAEGNEYEYFSLDERFRQLEEIDSEDVEKYEEALYKTWLDLWKQKRFPDIIFAYLEKWRDRFYLFDKENPFFQVIASDIEESKISKSKASDIAGKNMNRLISESANKVALFSPKSSADFNKEKLSEAEICRWLITLQGYSGLSDKVHMGQEKYKASKGWLYDLGGIYLKGNHLFETLMLNFLLAYTEGENTRNIQRPCWEYDSTSKAIESHGFGNINNLAGLYTAWSRAIYIDPETDVKKPFSCNLVKLPDLEHQDNFLEPMTLWRYNEQGENKEKYTPVKHQANKSMWRSFGLITGWGAENQFDSKNRKPGVIEWLTNIKNIAHNNNIEFENVSPGIVAVSMQDDGNATSWVPTDEIIDTLQISDFVLTDLEEDGWVIRVNEAIETTKYVVGYIYKNFISDIKSIRNISNNLFVNQKVEELYFKVDEPFRDWLSGINNKDSKDEKIQEWEQELKQMVYKTATEMIYHGSSRDFTGIEEKGELKNIATAYNTFINKLNKKLKTKEG